MAATSLSPEMPPRQTPPGRGIRYRMSLSTRAMQAIHAVVAILSSVARRSCTIRSFSGSAVMPGIRRPSAIAAHRVGGWQAAAVTGRTSGRSRVGLVMFRQHACGRLARGQAGVISSRSTRRQAEVSFTRMAPRGAVAGTALIRAATRIRDLPQTLQIAGRARIGSRETRASSTRAQGDRSRPATREAL
jgi:hypothetical protein